MRGRATGFAGPNSRFVGRSQIGYNSAVQLARKLIFALTLVIIAVISGDALARVHREISLFESDMRKDARFTGSALGHAVRRVWQAQGAEVGLAFVREVDSSRGDIDIRWVWLHPGGVVGRHVPAKEAARLLAGHAVTLRVDNAADGIGAMRTYVPVDVPGPRRGAVEITESLAAEHAYVGTTLRDTALRSAVLLGTSILVISGIGVFFVGRPAGALVAKTRRIGAGDLSGPLTLTQRDEMGELARELNAMCEQLAAAHERLRIATEARIAALEQLRHADRLATVGKLASGVAHELGTPLNVVAGRAQMIASGEATGDEIASSARIITEQARRITQIIRQLLDFARKRAPERVTTDLHPMAEHAVALLAQMADERGIALTFDRGTGACVALADEGQIQQVLMNIVANALQATDRGGHVSVRCVSERVIPPADHGGPEAAFRGVCVKDDGCGMDPETASRVFEPFFTTKDVGKGTGLGLSVAYGIVREHGGFITLESQPGKGSTFTVYLPPANTETNV